MILPVFLYFDVLLLFLQHFDSPQVLVPLVEGVDVPPVLHVLGSLVLFLLLLLLDGLLSLHFEQLALLHVLLVVIDVLLDDLLVLFFEPLFELLQLKLFFLLDSTFFLVALVDLVLTRQRSTKVSSW